MDTSSSAQAAYDGLGRALDDLTNAMNSSAPRPAFNPASSQPAAPRGGPPFGTGILSASSQPGTGPGSLFSAVQPASYQSGPAQGASLFGTSAQLTTNFGTRPSPYGYTVLPHQAPNSYQNPLYPLSSHAATNSAQASTANLFLSMLQAPTSTMFGGVPQASSSRGNSLRNAQPAGLFGASSQDQSFPGVMFNIPGSTRQAPQARASSLFGGGGMSGPFAQLPLSTQVGDLTANNNPMPERWETFGKHGNPSIAHKELLNGWQSESVQLVCGDKKVVLTASKKHLCHLPYFAKMLGNSRFIEAKENKVEMPDDELDVVAILLTWLTQGFPPHASLDTADVRLLVRLSLFARKLILDDLKEAIWGLLLEAFRADYLADDFSRILAGYDEILELEDANPMRYLFVHVVAHGVLTRHSGDPALVHNINALLDNEDFEADWERWAQVLQWQMENDDKHYGANTRFDEHKVKRLDSMLLCLFEHDFKGREVDEMWVPTVVGVNDFMDDFLKIE